MIKHDKIDVLFIICIALSFFFIFFYKSFLGAILLGTSMLLHHLFKFLKTTRGNKHD